MAAAAVCSLALVGVDTAVRHSTGEVGHARHAAAMALLGLSAAALSSLLLVVAVAALRRLEDRLDRRWPGLRRRGWVWPLAALVAALWAARPTAFYTFEGEGIRHSPVARWGPFALLGAVSVAAVVATLALDGACRALARQRVRPALLVGALAALGAALLLRLDLTLYVGLYDQLHTALEVTALLCAWALCWLGLRAVSGKLPTARWLPGGLATLALLSALLVTASLPVRSWAYGSLRQAWIEPVYAGRWLARLQRVEFFVHNPLTVASAGLPGLERLAFRYHLPSTQQRAVWQTPPPEPAALTEQVRALRERAVSHAAGAAGARRPEAAGLNILVYYVDTLRADVAADPVTMPHLARFAGEALEFRNAYAAGSDTLHSLPAITGGSYGLEQARPNDLLRLAERGGMRTVWMVAKSAREFLGNLLPRFSFQHSLEITDYAPGNAQVWGYGADQPTAARLVDQTLGWLAAHRDERFLAWVFNFDVHNWQLIDEAYFRAAARKQGMSPAGRLSYRYRVMARAVDDEFGRLLDGLRDLDLLDRTVVLFISDHGESLGRQDFWAHSVYLWEELVRVPLALRVPGVPPRVVTDKVSLVDVAPTLARFVHDDAEMGGYDGEDLLHFAVAEHPRRRLPILMVGTQKEQTVRIGIVDAQRPFRLVLPLESVEPELYDQSAADAEAREVSRAHPEVTLELLDQLVTSPLLPRRTSAP